MLHDTYLWLNFKTLAEGYPWFSSGNTLWCFFFCLKSGYVMKMLFCLAGINCPQMPVIANVFKELPEFKRRIAR